jgi:hypothetical protein
LFDESSNFTAVVDPAPFIPFFDALQILPILLSVYPAVSVSSVGDEQSIPVEGDGADRVGEGLIGEGDGVGVEVAHLWSGVENGGD